MTHSLPALALALLALLLTPAAVSAAPSCNETASPGESFSSLNSRIDPGETVCLPAGTYDWPHYISFNKDGVWFHGSGNATVVSAAWEVPGTDVAFSNMKMQANFNDGGSAVIKPLGDRIALAFLDISSNNQSKQGIQNGGGGGSPAGGFIVANKIHHNGADGQHDHGIYDLNSDNTIAAFNWIYRNAGWGLHLYPDADNALYIANTIANNGHCDDDDAPCEPDTNGRSLVFGGEGSQHSDGNTVSHSILADYGSNANRTLIHCYLAGSGNRVLFSKLRPQSGQSLNDCGSTVSLEGNEVGDPGFLDQAADDYRTTPDTFVPGPRP